MRHQNPSKIRRHKLHTQCLPLLAGITLLLCIFSPSLAEDGAHGGEARTPDQKTDTPKPGDAVKASRTTAEYAAKGMAPNPIAIDFDPRGNLYVVNAGRAGISVIDNRNSGLRKSNGVINDLQKTSVEDRLKQIEMLEEGGFYPKGVFQKADDKIHYLQDTDGDGVADKTSIFAENFNDKLDGIAAGVLYHEGKLFLTNIPHLWLLEDKDGDGDADRETEGERISMSYGYGIRWAFYGHDMHGLIKGPDGRIYWSIGDRGYNVKTKEGKTLYGPQMGAVFRMWPDGSGLEVFHEGLRNPQELAFDNYGNLFTGDNNSDSGDKARFIHVTEGGHSGWNQDVQSLRDRGPWNREKMWHPRTSYSDPLQPQWQTPPLKNVGRGPSGLAHYPGVGDVFAYNGSFLMCDYPAGVRHVQLQPQGATYKVTEDSTFVKGGTITDVAWGYDGRLYLSDWGGGWKPNPNGTIKTMVNDAAHAEQAAVIKEVKSLFSNGFDALSDEQLIKLLGHRDQRVRLNAQWQAAKSVSRGPLVAVLMDDRAPELAKLHALWALAMKARTEPELAIHLITTINDPKPQLRAQTARMIGELGYSKPTTVAIVELLNDPSPIVQYEAAIALGKIGTAEHVMPLLGLLKRNDNKDAAIRHAASYGLALIGDAEAINAQAQQNESAAARLGAVLALRRLESPLLAEYLSDDDILTSAEAVRGIYDMRIIEAMPALAALSDSLTKEQMIEPIMRRVIEVNIRLADTESASRLAKLAANPEVPEMWRELALKELDTWDTPREREGVWGSWWPRHKQPMDTARTALMAFMPDIIQNTTGKLNALARTIEQRHLSNIPPDAMARIVTNPDEPAELRTVVAGKLAQKEKDLAVSSILQVLTDEASTPELLMPMRALLTELTPELGVAAYIRAYGSGTLQEKQDAVRQLAKQQEPDALETIQSLAEALSTGDLPAELRLDVLQAISGNPELPAKARSAAAKYKQQNQIPGEEPFIRDASLAGGSVEAGKDVFFNHPGATCTQCHRLDNDPAQGPNLSGIGAAHDLNYIYTAIVKPSADIAEGYAQTVVNLKDGSIKSGRLLKEASTPDAIVLIEADGKQIKIQRENIEGEPKTTQESSMKKMNEALSPVELRDLVAYLASLTDTRNGRYAKTTTAGFSGPQIVSIAKGMPHGVWLPAILVGIAFGLGLILVGTMFNAGSRA